GIRRVVGETHEPIAREMPRDELRLLPVLRCLPLLLVILAQVLPMPDFDARGLGAVPRRLFRLARRDAKEERTTSICPQWPAVGRHAHSTRERAIGREIVFGLHWMR